MAEGPIVYVFKDLTPFATAAIGLGGLALGWLVTRRRNRVDKLREAWASWTASAFEAVERCSTRAAAEAAARAHLQEQQTKHDVGYAARLETVLAEELEPQQSAASEAIWRLRRDYHLLQILEDDDQALKPPASIINALLDQTADGRLFNSARALLGHIALDNRKRFLHPWRRWRRWIRPVPLRDPALDALDATAPPHGGTSDPPGPGTR